MDKPNSTTDLGPDEEIFGRLRDYVDALAERADHDPIAVLGDHRKARSGKRMAMISVAAAAVIVLIGSAAWIGTRDTPKSIESIADEQTTTTTPDDAEGEIDPSGWLMPDPARWVITEAYPPQTATAETLTGVWAWRIDGDVYVLVGGGGMQNLTRLDQAVVETGDGRVMMGWLDGDDRLGLQGYGVDEATLRSVAGSIVRTESGWTIPEAAVLVAEPATSSGPSESVQVGYSPVRSDGMADLSTVVTGIRRGGTAGDMYRELFEASSVGQVAETTVADQSGFVISGAFTSYALAYRDGTIFSWSTMTPDVDLVAMLRSVQAVGAEEWDQAVNGIDDVVGNAVAATLADADASIETNDPDDDPELPRYLLPPPWTIQFVTDMGLWSEEERAQRAALAAANAPPGGFADLIWTQGFAVSETTTPAGPLPFAVPDIVITISRRETDEPLSPDPGEGEPFSFAGLDGYIVRFDMFDPSADRGTRTETEVFATQGPLLVRIEAPFLTEEQVRRFARSLSIPGEDASHGFVSSAADTRLLLELAGQAGRGAGFYGRWLAAFDTESVDNQPQVSLWVESMTFERFQLEIMESRTRGLNYSPVPGTDYLADQYERVDEVVVDEDGNLIEPDESDVIIRTSLLHYDPDNQILVALDFADDLPATIDLFDQLIPTDIDTWREVVEHYNAKPLQPR